MSGSPERRPKSRQGGPILRKQGARGSAGAATDSLLRASVDARLKGKLQRGHAALSEFETNHMHRSQPVASPIVGIVSPDGKPYQRGVFTAVRPHKLSTETKDWREDRQYVGESPASFNNQVRKRALDHIREAQGDLKERAQVEFDQRVQAERDMLVRELWGVDADKARRTRIGQAMMHKVEQLARQSVLRQLNLEAEYVNVKELGFAQVINAETAELRKHLLEQRMMEETERLHATVEDSRRAREASQRPMSSSDTARESKLHRALEMAGQSPGQSPQRPDTGRTGRGSFSRQGQSSPASNIQLLSALETMEGDGRRFSGEEDSGWGSPTARRPGTTGSAMPDGRRRFQDADMWDEAWGFKQGNLLQTGVEAAREAMSAMEVKPEKEEDEEQAAASPADDRVRSVEAQRLGAAAEAMAAAEGRGKKLAERMRERVGAGLATWTDKAMATGTEMVLKTQNVALPEPGEIGMRPADMYIKVCRSLRTAPLTSVVAQLGPEARRVVLSGSYLGEGTAKALSSVVPHLRRLESFEAARCGAHDGSLSWLLGALLYCPVTSLDMSGNNLSEVGTVALSRLLIGRDPEGNELPPHPFSPGKSRPWTVHDADPSASPARPIDFFDPGPVPATPRRLLYESDRTAKLSGTAPGIATISRFNPYETIKEAAGRTAASMVATSRPTARGMGEFLSVAQGATGASAGLPQRPATAMTMASALRRRAIPTASRQHSVATCISALAAEPATGSCDNVPEDGLTVLPGREAEMTPLSLRTAAMRQLESDDFATYREIKPLPMRLPETKAMLRTLLSIDLSDNSAMGTRAASSLLEALKLCTRQATKKDHRMPLAHISLAGCSLTDTFAQVLADFIEENQTVRAIDLSRNHLHASFIPTIIPILPLNSVLSYLNLSHNGLGDASVCILLRTIAGIWRDDPVRLKIRRLGIAGTRMGRRATFALAAMLSSIRSSLLEYDPALPPAFTADWSFEVDISDHDLVGVAPVVLARQILRLSDIQGRQPDGGARVRVVADRVSTTCLARQGLLEGEVLYEAEELKGLIGDTDKGKKGGKGKGKGKKGKKGEKPRIVKVGERFNLECADEEHKDMLVLLVEHELLATAKDPPEKLFYTLRLGTRTYRLAGHDFPVGGKKSTFDIRDIKWDERLPERGALELAVLMGSDAKDLLRTLHPHGEDASVRAHLKPKATSTTGARANPDTVYWLPRSKWVQRKEAAEGGERGVSGDAVAGASTEKVDEEGVMEGGEGDGGIPGVEGSPSKATVSVGA